MVDTRAVMAAANNADLYEAIFRAHGTDFKRSNDAFIGREQPPPYYSNLTVLRPDRSDQIVGHLRDIGEICEGGIGFKDSFSEYDLRDQGFRVLSKQPGSGDRRNLQTSLRDGRASITLLLFSVGKTHGKLAAPQLRRRCSHRLC